ncbi:MAG: cbb3-type cytochrome c oxidase subunit 3 [Candidatus Kapabacteria bacterium]|nr:cbb3-type cytochrome c oxidase subunit 3 [Candidatus Kapabacteria bacterium]
MFKEIFAQINGIQLLPNISLIIFLAVFIMILIAVWKLDEKYVTKMENLPFENENKFEINQEGKNI